MRQTLLSLAAMALAAAPIAAQAAPCRDAHGRFAACVKTAAKPAAPRMAAAARAKPAVAAAPKRCKIGGRFASCSTPGAKPA